MEKNYLKITVYENGKYDVQELTEKAYEKMFDKYNSSVETINGLGSNECWMDLAHSKVILCKKESLNRMKNKFNLVDSKIGDIIKKTDKGYIIYSEKGKRLSKPFKTRKEAEDRLKEIEMFKHMKKDAADDYAIINNKGHYEIWKAGKLISTADNYSEAKHDVEELVKEDMMKQKVVQDLPEKKWRLWYTNSVDQGAYTIVTAKTKEEAIKKADKEVGPERRGNFRDIEILDSMEVKDMDVKTFLENLIVREGDPNNKLGKTYIRNLRETESLPKGVYFKAGSDTSGIIHFKGADYYYYLDRDGNLHIENHIHDELDKRFTATSYFDTKYRGVEDTFDSNHLEKIQDWILNKSNAGYYTRVIDNRYGEVWNFGIIDDPFELDKIQPYEEEEEEFDEEIITKPEYILWVVTWYNPNGVKFRGEFDSEEDAKTFMEENNDDAHIEMKIEKENKYVNDSLRDAMRILDGEKMAAKLKKVLKDLLLKKGYEESDIDEWVIVEIKSFVNDEGDQGVQVEMRNEFIGYYRLPEDVMNQLDAIVAPGYFEPYDSLTWDAFIFDAKLKGEY